MIVFFFSSRRRHTRWNCDWSSDVCSSDLVHDDRRLRALRARAGSAEVGQAVRARRPRPPRARRSAGAPRQRRRDPLHLPRGPERPRAGPGGRAPARRRAGRLLRPRPDPLARVGGAGGLGGGAREPAPLLHAPPRSGPGAAPAMTALAPGPALGQTRPMREVIAGEERRAALAAEAVSPLSSLSAFFPARDEEANLLPMAQAMLRVLPAVAERWELIIVDDGS